MDFAQHQNDLRAQRRANRVLSAIVGALSLSVLLCLVVIVSIVGSDRTVIVPPNIDRTFWVTKEKASREYLEEMASYVAWLVLDVTPTTVDWKKNVLLNWVAPDQHAAMKTKMDIEAERLRSNNAATFFLVQQLAADEAKQSVVVNPYAKGGQYARFFSGRNTIDFSNDFVVIESEELKRKPDLQAVVNIILFHAITREMYLTRNRKKVWFIDELKQQLGDSSENDVVMAAAIDEAARRARKYGGSLVTATQNGDDYFTSAQMESALKCSDWTFLLRQKPESIELLARTGRFSMDEPKKRLLNSLRMEPGMFSECYITSPIGEGVARIILDPFSHLLFSNKLDDNAPLDALLRQGLSIDDAITELLRRRGYAV